MAIDNTKPEVDQKLIEHALKQIRAAKRARKADTWLRDAIESARRPSTEDSDREYFEDIFLNG